MGHRRYLQSNHKFRCDKKSFNGEEELRLPPTQLPEVDVLEQLEHLESIILGKSQKKKKNRKILHVCTIGRKRVYFFNYHIGKHSCYVII